MYSSFNRHSIVDFSIPGTGGIPEPAYEALFRYYALRFEAILVYYSAMINGKNDACSPAESVRAR